MQVGSKPNRPSARGTGPRWRAGGLLQPPHRGRPPDTMAETSEVSCEQRLRVGSGTWGWPRTERGPVYKEPGVHIRDRDRRGMWGSGMAREERVRVTDGALGWHGHGGFEGLLVHEGRPWPSLLPPAPLTCSALKLLEPRAVGLGDSKRHRWCPQTPGAHPRARRPPAAPGPRGRTRVLLLQGAGLNLWFQPQVPPSSPPL